MFDTLTTYHLIIIFSITIIISYFFNLYAKKTGIPAVLMLIGLGVIINYTLRFSGVVKPNLFPVLEVLGVVGLILIVLEAALDLQLLKEKIGLIIKSFLVALIGLVGTAYLAALALNFIMDIEVLSALLYTIPLSILSSAIILPSIDDLDEDKREFMIYESTFSDIIGIIGFYTVLTVVDSQPGESVTGEVIGSLALTVVLSIIISYILIYVFQNIKGHVKLFLLIAILLLLYAIGKMFHLSSLIIILVFGMILNNYKVFFRGFLRKLLNKEKVDGVLGDMKVITAESAFVVRTFFFIIFGWFADIGSLLSFKVVGVGLVVLAIIYTVRVIVLFLFNGKDIITRLFLAPRGLITILLFFTIPDEMFEYKIHEDLRGVLLFIILISCFIMTWSMINYKKKITQIVEGEDDKISNTNKDDGEILNTNKEISEDDSIDILKNSIDN